MLVAMGFGMAGCAATGPTSSADFAALVAAAVPKSEGTPRITGSGSWFPNTRGFAPLRSSLLSRPTDPIPGAIAVTDKAIVFVQWDDREGKFEPMKKISFTEVEDATLDSFGLGRRLVIKKRDLSVDSFDFTKAAGNIIDAEKTQAAVTFVQSRLNAKLQ